MTRSLPAWVAPVAEILELEQPIVVHVNQLAHYAREVGITFPTYRVVQELAEKGWLLPTEVRGVWEFSPASHAGAVPHADPFVTLRAAHLAADRPEGFAVALRSALWQHDLMDRAPNRHDVAVPRISALQPGISRSLRRSYNVSSFDSRLAPRQVNGVPVHRPETVLVHLAEGPTAVSHWHPILDALDLLVSECSVELVEAEASGRTNSVLVRLAYLLGGRSPEIVDALKVRAGSVVWFGPRAEVLRSDKTWNVVDTILPRSPETG